MFCCRKVQIVSCDHMSKWRYLRRRLMMLASCVTWWSCEPPWSWVNLFSFCEWASSCVSGGGLGCRCRSGWGCPSLCTAHNKAREMKVNLHAERKAWQNELSPGGVLSVVRGLGLAGAPVSGGRVRGRAPAAPGAAALSEVGFAPRLLFLPARRVWVPSWRCRRAPVVCLTPTRAAVALGRVATFCPGGE